jgi:hypothetical protein
VRHVRSTARLTDAAFWAASATAFLLALLSIAAFDSLRQLRPAANEAFLVTQFMRIPGAEGERFHRIGWTPLRVAELGEQLGASARLAPVSLQRSVLAWSEGRLAVSTLSIPRSVAVAMARQEALVCDGTTLHLGPRLFSQVGPGPLRLGGRQAVAVSAQLGWLQGLVGQVPDALVLVCSPSDELQAGSATWLVATGDGSLLSRLQQARAGAAGGASESFATQLRIEHLSEAVRRSADRELGWVQPVLAALIGMGLLLNLAWAGLGALTDRPGDRVRWLVGGSPWRIALRAGARTATAVASAGLLAAVLFETLVAAGFVQSPVDRIGALGMFLALVGIAAGASAALRAVSSLAGLRGANPSASGSRITSSTWPYLIAWATGLGLAMLVSSLAVSLLWFAQRLDRIDPGFQAAGLHAVSIRPVDPEPDAVASYRQLQPARAGLAEALDLPKIEAACVPPWRLAGHAFLDDDDGSTGLVMPVTAGFLELIGARLARGAHFPEGSERDAQRVLIQTGGDSEREPWHRVHTVLGETEGLLVGTYAPEPRSILFRPIGDLACDDIDLVYRSPRLSTSETRRRMDELHQRMPQFAWSEPQAVDALYRDARSGVRRLSGLMLGVSAVGLMLMLVLSATLAAALEAVQRRETAVRMALGASSVRMARRAVLRSLLWCTPAAVAALLSLAAVNGLMRAYVLGWIAPPAFGSPAMAAAVSALSAGFLGISIWRTLSRLDLRAELAG